MVFWVIFNWLRDSPTFAWTCFSPSIAGFTPMATVVEGVFATVVEGAVAAVVDGAVAAAVEVAVAAVDKVLLLL